MANSKETGADKAVKHAPACSTQFHHDAPCNCGVGGKRADTYFSTGVLVRLNSTPVRKHAPGSYRMTLEGGRFAQFVKGRFTSSAKWGDEFRRDSNGRHWAVEIRDAETGAILRYAGVHLSLREAAEEVRGLRL